jgi:hypothetical protein
MHSCKGCGRSTVSADEYCSFCHSGLVPPRLVGILRWKRGVLVPIEEKEEES